MRPNDPKTIPTNRTDDARKCAYRLAGNICGWIGEAFIGIACLCLSRTGEFEKARDSEKGTKRALLPGNRSRVMEPLKPRCFGCKREVDQLIETVLIDNGLTVKNVRCEDCTEIYMDRLNKLEKAKWN